MKKLIAILMVLAMTGTCGAIQPALVKDPFNKYGVLYGWLPADDAGIYWWRVDFSPPKGSTTIYKAYLCIDQVVYGKPKKGKIFIYGADGWSEGGGTWGSNTSTDGWIYRYCSTQNAYIDALIPAGYNRIQLISYDIASGNGALLAISWDDDSTTGLDITSYDSGAGVTQQKEIVIATNASPDGVKKLRIKNNDTSGTIRIIGVRCWDTDAQGTPTTARTGDADAWEGHDFVDIYYPYAFHRVANSDISFPLIAPHLSTIDIAFYWLLNSIGTFKWSGGQNHWGSGYANYIYHSGSHYLTNGPDLFLDGTDKGGKLEIARNTMLVGNSVHISSSGFLDPNNNGTEEGQEPDVIWEYNLSPNGLAIKYTITWNTNCTISTVYCPMFQATGGASGDKIIYPLDANEYSISSDQHKYGAQHSSYLFNDKKVIVTLSTDCPVTDMMWLNSNTKLYDKIQTYEMYGGNNVVEGDIWALGGNWQVTQVPRTIPDGDIDCDGKVDFYDFTILADNWLIDCFNDPTNPACISQ